MNVIGLIPARMASTRFPNKPMALIQGIPMLGHVLKRSQMSEMLSDVYVTTCDQEIVDYIEGLGSKAVMTSDKHERASDRCTEAMIKIEAITGQKVDMVVMIQGDEPMLVPEMIDSLVRAMLNEKSAPIVNLMAELKTREEQEDPNDVKVVVDLMNYALYFSREAIPSRKKTSADFTVYKQLGIIMFQRDFLIKYNELAPTPLEIIESVDMLRVLEHGYKIKMELVKYETVGVDTPEDLARAEEAMAGDALLPRYKGEF